MSKQQRKRLGRRHKKHIFDRRPKLSRQELIDYLREKNFRSKRQLETGREKSEPRTYDYQQEFGSWFTAVLEAFPESASRKPDLPTGIPITDEYLSEAVVTFNLWTRRRYQEARNLRPDIIPSMYYVCNRWGTFSVLIRIARATSLEPCMNAYLALMRRLGHTPSSEECRRHGVMLDAVVEHFGGKRQLDALLVDWRRLNER